MIFIVLFFGLTLRLVSINQSLWLDEATTALVSRMSLGDFFTNFISNDFHPPLYYLIVKFWSDLFGSSEVALRIPSVIFGALTIYLVYLIAKQIRLKSPITPALFLATSGLNIYYSQEARMYAMVAFLVSYLVLLFIRQRWLFFSVVLALIFLTDYVSLLILPVLLMYSYTNKIEFKKIIYSTIPLVVTFIAWLPFLTKQLQAGLSLKHSAWWNILGTVTFKNVALIPTKFMIGRISFENKILYAGIIMIISLIFIYVIGKAKNKLIWYWFGLSLFFGIIISFFIPTLTYFRYLFVLPAFYLLLSESTSKIFIFIILLINLLSSGFYLFDKRFQREDWRGLAIELGDNKVVFPANSQKEALVYYGKDKLIISKEEVNSNDKNIWLSRYVWNVFDPDDTARGYIENLGYNKISEHNFNGVLIYKYENSN